MSLGHPFPARIKQPSTRAGLFGQQPEPLEERPVADAVAVLDQFAGVAVAVPEVLAETTGDMRDAAARLGSGQWSTTVRWRSDTLTEVCGLLRTERVPKIWSRHARMGVKRMP